MPQRSWKLWRESKIGAPRNEILESTPDEEIINLLKKLGSQVKVAKALGVAKSTFHDYIMDKDNLRSATKQKAPQATVYGVGPEVEIDVEKVRRRAEERFKAKHDREGIKESQRVTFPHGPVCIVFVGDQHIGNAGTDVGRIYAEQELINEIPGAYVWQLGDCIDNFIVGKLQVENFKESLPILEQWELARHYLAGFGNKLIAYTGGNHEQWTAMMTGIDYRRDICPEGVLYDGDEIRATLEVGLKQYKVWARHKWRGSSQYNATHQLERAARFDSPEFDLYVGAHLHTGSIYREFTLDGRRKAAIQVGAYKIHDSYQKTMGFPRNDHSTAAAVVLHEDGSFFGCSSLPAVANYMQMCYEGS